MEKTVNTQKQEDILSQFAQLAADYEKAKELITLLKSENTGLDDKIAAERITSRSLDNRNQGLSMELQEAKNTIFHLNIEINLLRENIEALKSELETYQETCTDQEWDIANKLAVIDFSKGKIETLETQKNKLEADYQGLRLGLIAKQQKLDAQQEWNNHLTAEITRLLAYEKSTKAIITKWNHPKIWDVWNLFLKWLFPTDQKPSSQLIRQMKEEYRKQHKEKF